MRQGHQYSIRNVVDTVGRVSWLVLINVKNNSSLGSNHSYQACFFLYFSCMFVFLVCQASESWWCFRHRKGFFFVSSVGAALLGCKSGGMGAVAFSLISESGSGRVPCKFTEGEEAFPWNGRAVMSRVLLFICLFIFLFSLLFLFLSVRFRCRVCKVLNVC